MDTIYKYFLKEMLWLEKAGKEFAEANPGLSTFLHGNGVVSDPHVDRILEGAAFLTARLEKRLDDSLMHVADDILTLTYPQLMAPQPAMTMVKFERKKNLRSIKSVPVETQLLAKSSRSRSRHLRLKCCDHVDAGDFDVTKVELDETTYIDRSALRITIAAANGSLAGKEPLPAELPIMLFWSNLADSCTLRHALGHLSEPAHIFALDRNGAKVELENPPSLSLRLPGEYEPLLDTGDRVFPGYRLLREFFALPQRFLHFNLKGLDLCGELADVRELVIEMPLPLAQRELPPIEVRNFVLFTSGAINTWDGSAKAITCDGGHERYFLEPDHNGEVAITRVSEIRALHRGADAFTEVAEFNYFNRGEPCYRAGTETYRLSDSQRSVRWFLDLSNISTGDELVMVSSDLRLCNTDAIEVLGSRTVLSNYEGLPEELSAQTFTPCSDYVPALDAEGQYWQLIDMISCNLASLSDPLRLQMFLQHLNRTGSTIASKAIRGIRKVSLKMNTTTIKQQPVKLATMRVEVDEEEYLNRGYLELFYDVFREFLREFIPLNCLLELEICNQDTGECLYRWEPETDRATGS